MLKEFSKTVSAQWWCPAVARSGGAQWWCAVVVRSGGAQRWRAAVVRSGGAQWWCAVVVRSAKLWNHLKMNATWLHHQMNLFLRLHESP